MNRRLVRSLPVMLLATVLFGVSPALAGPARTEPTSNGGAAATPIQHFVYMMQGDRTFDNYFGTFPGADGIPANTCQKAFLDRPNSACVKPFDLHGSSQQPLGVGTEDIAKQYNNGKLNGFVAGLSAQGRDGSVTMGHYDQRDLPVYWDLAREYVLFDRFFSATMLGVRANRSFWVSGVPPALVGPKLRTSSYQNQLTIFDRLQAAGISWKFYVQDYNPQQTIRTGGTQPIRVPLLENPRFLDNPSLNSHIVDLNQYYEDVRSGQLPAVAYIASSGAAERSARSVPAGQRLVTDLVGQLMLSRYWQSSAFMLSYDGSGGWFDHVVPPQVDRYGYGFRVPALLVSPYAKRGQVDHTVLDITSGLAFVEQNWNLKPLATRDASANSLLSAFDFAGGVRPAHLPLSTPAPARPPLVSVGIVYWCYGAAVALTVIALIFAAARPVPLFRRRRSASAADAPSVIETAGVRSP
jgi:phospholipase C